MGRSVEVEHLAQGLRAGAAAGIRHHEVAQEPAPAAVDRGLLHRLARPRRWPPRRSRKRWLEPGSWKSEYTDTPCSRRVEGQFGPGGLVPEGEFPGGAGLELQQEGAAAHGSVGGRQLVLDKGPEEAGLDVATAQDGFPDRGNGLETGGARGGLDRR
jgi:hypothetical protein